MKHKTLFQTLIVATAMAVAPQFAAAGTITYVVTGTCSYGCSGTATGTLTLTDYTPGSALDFSNFVSFHYQSSDLDTTITALSHDANATIFLNPLPLTSGHPLEAFQQTFPGYGFGSDSTGGWSIGFNFDPKGGDLSDYGVAGSSAWRLVEGTQTPEPATWGLLGVGCAVMIAGTRRFRS